MNLRDTYEAILDECGRKAAARFEVCAAAKQGPNWADVECLNIQQGLNKAFIWADTYDGHNYWVEIANKI